MPEKMTMDILKQRLKLNKHKLTTQRRTVLNVFIENPGEHLNADEVYKILCGQGQDIGLATVYRSLDLLADLDILQKMEFGDGCSRYEIKTMTPDEHQHHHMKCMKCGKVFEFQGDLLDKLEKDISQKSGFQIVDHQVIFYGYCKKCQ